VSIDVTVYLERSILQLADDPTVAVVCGTSGRSDNFEQEGTFRSYANGATRLILGTATQRVLPITLRALSPTQVQTVRSMIGRTCLFRDTYGRRVWGSFLATATTDIPLSGFANDDLMTDVALNLQMIEHTEGV
jgi:hypothetical protein